MSSFSPNPIAFMSNNKMGTPIAPVRVRSPVFALLLAAMFLIAHGAQAATIIVNDAGDTAADDGVCTLREAIRSMCPSLFRSAPADPRASSWCGV